MSGAIFKVRWRQWFGQSWRSVLLAAAFVLPLVNLPAWCEQRFPPPEFVETNHQLPTTTTPAARAIWLQYVDLGVLVACLGMATWLIYRKRSRKAILALSLFSLAYFGFWRKGCICAIGSVQNVVLGLFDSTYAVPITVLGFFVLPIAVALFAGRSFCAAVCPHGALQDLVLLKPVKLPGWLEHGLGILPFVYLGAAVLFAATGSAFIICQYDPFVPLFRLNGRTLMVLSGVALLVLGVFVGRPYCRFICPYGALLKMGATVAKWRVRVTPDYCTQCRLCEASCPYGAMRDPETAGTSESGLRRDRIRLTGLIVLLPILVLSGAWLGHQFSRPAARLHPTVQLADELVRNEGKPSPTGTLTPEQLGLERARQAPQEIETEAVRIQKKFEIGSWFFGGWIGLVLGIKLLSLSVRRKRTDYEPDRGSCVACARCFEYCPNEMARRGLPMPALAAAQRPAGVASAVGVGK